MADSTGNGWHAGPSQVLPRSSASFTAGITNSSGAFTIGSNPGVGRASNGGSGPQAGLRSLFRSHTIDTQLQAQLPGASGALLQHMTSLPAFVDSSLPDPPQVWPLLVNFSPASLFCFDQLRSLQVNRMTQARKLCWSIPVT